MFCSSEVVCIPGSGRRPVNLPVRDFLDSFNIFRGALFLQPSPLWYDGHGHGLYSILWYLYSPHIWTFQGDLHSKSIENLKTASGSLQTKKDNNISLLGGNDLTEYDACSLIPDR